MQLIITNHTYNITAITANTPDTSPTIPFFTLSIVLPSISILNFFGLGLGVVFARGFVLCLVLVALVVVLFRVPLWLPVDACGFVLVIELVFCAR